MVNGVSGVPGPIVPSPVAVEAKVEPGFVTVLRQHLVEARVKALILILHPAILIRVLLVMKL